MLKDTIVGVEDVATKDMLINLSEEHLFTGLKFLLLATSFHLYSF